MFDAPLNPAGIRFRLGGVPITVAWTAFIVPVLFGVAFPDPRLALGMGALVLGSVLIHELGHAAAFRAYGVRSTIVLHAMGGVTRGEQRVAKRSGRVLVSLAGPLAELILLGVPAVWLHRTADLAIDEAYFVEIAVLVTVGWSLFNLLPIQPLDGGHVAEELLGVVLGERGFVVSRVLSAVVAMVVAWVAFTSGWVLAAMFLIAMAWQSVQALRQHRDLAHVGDLRPALDAYNAGRTAETLALLLPELDKRRGPGSEALAVSIAAWAALAEDDPRTAHSVLTTHPLHEKLGGHLRAIAVETDRSERINATVDAWLDGGQHLHRAAYVRWMDRLGLLDDVIDRLSASRAELAVAACVALQELLFREGQFARSARLGDARLRAGLDGHDDVWWLLAFNTACSLDRDGRPEEGLAWLAVAIEAGLPDPTIVDTDPDLANIRSQPGYPEVRAQLRFG